MRSAPPSIVPEKSDPARQAEGATARSYLFRSSTI